MFTAPRGLILVSIDRLAVEAERTRLHVGASIGALAGSEMPFECMQRFLMGSIDMLNVVLECVVAMCQVPRSIHFTACELETRRLGGRDERARAKQGRRLGSEDELEMQLPQNS